MLLLEIFKCGEERRSGGGSCGEGSCGMAAPECEREIRKRRERRDSGSGCAHERKERRPHSEERVHPPQQPPPPPPQNYYQHLHQPPLQDCNRLEVERRAERLSRARRPQYGKRRRAAARAPRVLKENEVTIVCEETVYSSSPPPPCIDLAVLHRQLGREEPARSWAAEQDDFVVTPAPEPERYGAVPTTRNLGQQKAQHSTWLQPDKRLEKIKKKINILKKNISKYEGEYQIQHGHSISQSDRMTDVQLTRMDEELRRLQAEKHCIKTDPAEYELRLQAAKQQKERDERLEIALKSDQPMAEIVRDIEEWLECCRCAGGRSIQTEETWTGAQLAAEKACVQRALLRLEASRGRPPAHSAERGAARHLYERYRSVKRALATRQDTALGGLNGELATIHEHEAMLFNSSIDSSSDSQERPSDDISQGTTTTPLQSPPTKTDTEEIPSSTSSAKSITTSDEQGTDLPNPSTNEALHCLGLEELSRVLLEAKMQKSILKRSIKEYEVSFEIQNARKLQRDDKMSKEEEYIRYKAVKARIKLLNALINKQKVLP